MLRYKKLLLMTFGTTLVFPYSLELWVYIEQTCHIAGDPESIPQPSQLISQKNHVVSNSELQFKKFSYRVVIKVAANGAHHKVFANTVERRLSERQSSGTSNIRTHILFVKIFNAFLFLKKIQYTVKE